MVALFVRGLSVAEELGIQNFWLIAEAPGLL
jgi:hypothetical protein